MLRNIIHTKEKNWHIIIQNAYRDIEETNVSKMAYYYCKYYKDIVEVRNFITDSFYAFYYCKYIENRLDMRLKIKEGPAVYLYCLFIENRPDMKVFLSGDKYLHRYCLFVENDPHIAVKISDDSLRKDIQERAEKNSRTQNKFIS